MKIATGYGKMTALVLALSLFAGMLLAGGLKFYRDFSASETENEAHEKPLADEWFYEQRAYPLTEIPRGARAHALEQLEREEQRVRRLRLEAGETAESIAADPLVWQALGPQPITNGNTSGVQKPVSGRVSAIALDPGYNGTSNQKVYVGAAQGGVWRSTDNGATWTPLIDDQPSLAIGSIAVDPNNANVIYVGTGEGNASADNYYGAGLLKSTDGGATWAQITGPNSTSSPTIPAFLNASIPRIAIDPTNPQALYLCTRGGQTYGATGGSGAAPLGQRGVWKSTDGGTTWANLDPTGSGGGTSGTDLVIDPLSTSRVFAGMLAQGVYRSTTGGSAGSWEKLTNGLPTSVGRITLAVGPPLAPATNSTVYAAIADSAGSTLLGIYRSTDGGTNWTKTTSSPSASATFYNLSLAVDPVDANIIYFGEVSLSRSTDGGTTWVNQMSGNGNGNGGLHVDQHAIAISPVNHNILFKGNDGGIWRTDNATDTVIGWNNLNQTLNTVQFQSVALHPVDLNFLLGGTQDNGTNRFTGSPGWTRVAGGDGGSALIDQSNPTTVYHSFQNYSGATRTADFGPRVSFNSGDSWTDRGCRDCAAAPGNMNPTDRVQFYAPLALHKGFTQSSGNVIYFGTHRVYRSADRGQTWTGLGASTDGFGTDLTKGSGRVSAIATHPVLDLKTTPPGEIVWVGTTDGNVQVTTNAGMLAAATFTNVTKAPLPNRFVTDIAPDPTNAQRAYLTCSGFNISTPGTTGHVFVTTDQGTSWKDISGNLPDVPVTSITIDPFQANTLYLGTDLGVFQTSDGGTTWARLGTGMPKVAIFIVRYHEATRTLVAATHGRGMYRLPLARPVTTVSAANYSRSALAAEGIAAAFGTGLATSTISATSLPLPTTLAGTTVKVRDVSGTERLAPLFFVSVNQVNYQIPPGIQSGPVAVTITSGDGTISTGSEQVAAVAPSLFTANSSGNGVPAAYAVRVRNGVQTIVAVSRFDNTLQYVAEPIDLGPAGDQVVLVLYGTGVRNRSALSAVSVSFSGTSVQPDYAAELQGFIGLDQINVSIPRSLIGRGDVDVVLTADNAAANTVRIKIK